MKILFHTNTLSYRGTTVAVRDYATYNQSLLGNQSIICYDTAFAYAKDLGTEPAVLESLQSRFKVLSHCGQDDLSRLVDQEKPDLLYMIHAGNGNYVAPGCATAIHAVFQYYNPHGHRYAYISEWLALTMNQRHSAAIPWVPHMVTLPSVTDNYREILGIPQSNTVIGRMGGYYTFDIPFVKQAITEVLAARQDYTFVFVGTEPWISHPQVRFLTEIHSPQAKSNFIASCDAMIHARSGGESFGLAIAEALSLNKPVLAWEGGHDQNHQVLLNNSNLLYSESTVKEKLMNIKDLGSQATWSDRIQQFAPWPVMQRFKEVFL